jgi:hypothetical protein
VESKEVKTGTDLAEFSKECYGSKTAILSMMMIVVMMMMMMMQMMVSLTWTNKRAVICKSDAFLF